jgi:DNA-binding winged helix-turn-helix (wHTH) protein
MGSKHTTDEPPAPVPWRNNSIVRGGDEGIPVCVIARMFKHPAGEVRSILKEAIAKGQILVMPRDDWPAGSQRDIRLPDCVRFDCTNPSFTDTLMRRFNLTANEAEVFSVLIRRPETTKTSLHMAIQRPDKDETDEKIIDVIICKIRKKFIKQGPSELAGQIKTIWGRGYYLTPEARKFIIDVIGLPYDPSSCRTEAEVFGGDQDRAVQGTARTA